MFNRGTFNRQRFNLQEKPTEIALYETLADAVEAGTELAGDFHLNAAAEEAVKASITAACELTESMGAGGTLSGAFALGANYYIYRSQNRTRFNLARFNLPTTPTDITLTDALSAENALTQDCYIVKSASAHFLAAADIGGDLHIDSVYAGTLEFSGTAAGDYTAAKINCYETLLCFVGTASYDTLYTTVDVTIPAGGRLIIDSENFTCLLGEKKLVDQNGRVYDDDEALLFDDSEDEENIYEETIVYENVLDKYDGEWVTLDRDVKSIVFNCGWIDENWTITMIYTERWL